MIENDNKKMDFLKNEEPDKHAVVAFSYYTNFSDVPGYNYWKTQTFSPIDKIELI